MVTGISTLSPPPLVICIPRRDNQNGGYLQNGRNLFCVYDNGTCPLLHIDFAISTLLANGL
jgi:hypothetical protein